MLTAAPDQVLAAYTFTWKTDITSSKVGLKDGTMALLIPKYVLQ